MAGQSPSAIRPRRGAARSTASYCKSNRGGLRATLFCAPQQRGGMTMTIYALTTNEGDLRRSDCARRCGSTSKRREPRDLHSVRSYSAGPRSQSQRSKRGEILSDHTNHKCI
jgi:hypothetical protein